MQQNNPAITVLMPAYNAAEYIAEAIDSVLAQTFTDFELVIVNDGSTDDTEQIIRSYTDPRIRLHTQANAGVIGALNAGLALCRGELVARFDADDVCYPHRLQLQYDFMQLHPEYVLIGSATDYIDKDGEYLFEWQPDAYSHEDLQRIIYVTCPFDHPTVMYRRDVALKLGGYPKGAIHFEDHLFWTLFFKEGKLCNMPERLIKHRFNPSSVTIDERWRGPEFKKLKYDAIKQGYIQPEEAARLKELLAAQDLHKYKEAAYYSMIGKKFLWNNYDPKKARKNLLKAINITPFKPEPYFLYLLSFMGKGAISYIYNRVKSKQ